METNGRMKRCLTGGNTRKGRGGGNSKYNKVNQDPVKKGGPVDLKDRSDGRGGFRGTDTEGEPGDT